MLKDLRQYATEFNLDHSASGFYKMEHDDNVSQAKPIVLILQQRSKADQPSSRMFKSAKYYHVIRPNTGYRLMTKLRPETISCAYQ